MVINKDCQQVNTLVKLCGPYIQSLSIRSLVPTDIPVQRTTSPEMADLVTSQRSNGNKTEVKRNGDVMSRGERWIYLPLVSFSNETYIHSP